MNRKTFGGRARPDKLDEIKRSPDQKKAKGKGSREGGRWQNIFKT